MKEHICPKVTVDAICVTNGKIVLIRRKNDPYKGKLALPGGFVEVGETTEAAIVREMKEETNLDFRIGGLVGVYSEPDRDTRGHAISITYWGWARDASDLQSGDDAAHAEWMDVDAAVSMAHDMAFDHGQMLIDFRESDAEWW